MYFIAHNSSRYAGRPYWFSLRGRHYPSWSEMSPIFDECVEWCYDNFGLSGGGDRWLPSSATLCISFRDASDAMLFKLRWC